MKLEMIGLKNVGTSLAIGAFVMGCAVQAPAVQEAPAPGENGLDELQQISNSNVDGSWTLDAYVLLTGGTWYMSWGATFTGPANKSRKMGACLLQQFQNATGAVACNSEADCTSAPSTLPSGGFRYCVAPNGTGTKYCAFRPGTQASYCVGTPATGAAVSLPSSGSRTLQSEYNSQPTPVTPFIAYGCFEGCTSIAGSVSAVATSWADCNPTEYGTICTY